MSISKAKKARQKLSQRGQLTPESLRGSWQGINPSMKRTPTLQEKQMKLNRKHRRNHANYSDDSFFILKRRGNAVGGVVLQGLDTFKPIIADGSVYIDILSPIKGRTSNGAQ